MHIDTEIVDKKNLTCREADVFKLLCDGLPDKSIACVLGISIKTVSAHIDHIYEKLGIRWSSLNTRVNAVALAVASGMVKIGLHLVFAVVLQSALLSDADAVRTRVSASRVVRIRRVVS